MSHGTPTVHVSVRQLGAILDVIPARVALLDRDRRHRYVNHEYARFTGLPREALLGRTVAEVIGAAAYEAVQEHGERAMAGETVQWAGWLPYADGADRRFVQRFYIPHRDEAGAVDGYLVVARDLTDLKEGERRLSEQLGLNAAITASALDCVVVIDEAGQVVEFNPAAERTFGYTRAAVLNRNIGDIIVPEHLRARHATGFARYLATGEAHVLGRRMEIEGLRASGEVFPLELAITEVRLPERRLFTAYLRDLTASRAAAAELQRSREALHQSEKMAAFGSLLAGVAHELNNPLSVVIGNALMLSEDAADASPDLAQRAGRIHAAAERCGRIVRTFLSMARQRPAVIQPVPLRPLVHDVLELLAYTMRTSNISVEAALPDGLPDTMGDPDQLHQVVVNLVVNAQQALAGQPEPRRITLSAAGNADGLTLVVADNGPGVPEAISHRIFDPFFTTKSLGAGTGIGLAVSRGIVEAHGGRLTLGRAERGGARFEVTLRSATAGSEPTQTEDDTPERPFRHCVLIVDDEPEIAAVLAQMAGRQGVACDIAAGSAARSLLEGRDYDAILCDLHMREVDGPTLFAWLGAHKPHLQNRLAFVTADTLGEAASRFLAHAGRPVLEKPFGPAELRRVLAALLPETTETRSRHGRDRPETRER